jgi:hypothetical protein
MGIFDAISNIAERAVDPLIALATGGPSAAIATIGKPPERTQILERNENQMSIYSGFGEGQIRSTSAGTGVSQAASPGFFASGGALRSGLRDFGGFLGDFAPVAGVFGLGDRFSQMPASGATTIINQRPDETAMSGEILGANLGMAPALFQAGRNFLRTPGGQTALGFGGAALGAAFAGDGQSAPRITRKMKSDVRRIYMMAGMNPDATAQILNNLGTYPRMNFNASLVFFILTKRFRNDGPVVTKAAVRKTKTTLRRMKGVVDMYNNVCKPTTRRAPARRAAPKAVQLIKN